MIAVFKNLIPPPPTTSHLWTRGGSTTDTVCVSLNSNVPQVLSQPQGLTDLSLSYACLSGQLLTALQQSQKDRGGETGGLGKDFPIDCVLDEHHLQVSKK